MTSSPLLTKVEWYPSASLWCQRSGDQRWTGHGCNDGLRAGLPLEGARGPDAGKEHNTPCASGLQSWHCPTGVREAGSDSKSLTTAKASGVRDSQATSTVVAPGCRQRVPHWTQYSGRNQQCHHGTWGGEVARHGSHYTAFPMFVLFLHWRASSVRALLFVLPHWNWRW